MAPPSRFSVHYNPLSDKINRAILNGIGAGRPCLYLIGIGTYPGSIPVVDNIWLCQYKFALTTNTRVCTELVSPSMNCSVKDSHGKCRLDRLESAVTYIGECDRIKWVQTYLHLSAVLNSIFRTADRCNLVQGIRRNKGVNDTLGPTTLNTTSLQIKEDLIREEIATKVRTYIST